MKKSVLIVSFILIVILVSSFVSAGWFGDFLGKITGNVIQTECILMKQFGTCEDFCADEGYGSCKFMSLKNDCSGTEYSCENGEYYVYCKCEKESITISIPTPINGVCNSTTTAGTYSTAPTTNLCSSGTASTVYSDYGIWIWVCSGSGGGISVSCNADYKPATIMSPSVDECIDYKGICKIKCGSNEKEEIDYGCPLEKQVCCVGEKIACDRGSQCETSYCIANATNTGAYCESNCSGFDGRLCSNNIDTWYFPNTDKKCYDGICKREGVEEEPTGKITPDIKEIISKSLDDLRETDTEEFDSKDYNGDNKFPTEINHPFVLYTDINLIKERVNSPDYAEFWNEVYQYGQENINLNVKNLNDKILISRHGKVRAFIYAVTGDENYGKGAWDALINMDVGKIGDYEAEETLLNFAETYDIMKGADFDFEKYGGCDYAYNCEKEWNWDCWCRKEKCNWVIKGTCEERIKNLLAEQMALLAVTSLGETTTDDLVRKNNLHIRRYSTVATTALVLGDYDLLGSGYNAQHFFNSAMDGDCTFGLLGALMDFLKKLVSSDSWGFCYDGIGDVINHQSISDREGGWAEGPYYMRYTFLATIPFMKATENLKMNTNWIKLDRFERLVDWSIKIRMPNGARPPYDDSALDINYFFSGYLNKDVYNWDWINAERSKFTNGDSVSKSAASKVDAISYYDSSLGVKEPDWTPTQFLPKTGNAVFRSDWGEDAVYLMALAENGAASDKDNEFFTEKDYGHEHDDLFSFILYAYGKYLVIDPGYYSWGDSANPREAKDHNVILMNNNYIEEEGTIDMSKSFTTDLVDYGEISWNKNERGILFVDKEYFIIYDLLKYNSDYVWKMNGNGLKDTSSFKEYKVGETTKGAEWIQGDVGLLAYTAGNSNILFNNYKHYFKYKETNPEELTSMSVSRNTDNFLTVLYPSENQIYPNIIEEDGILKIEKDDWKGIAFVNKANTNVVYNNDLINFETDASKFFVKIKQNKVEYIFADDVKKLILDDQELVNVDVKTTALIKVNEGNIEIYSK